MIHRPAGEKARMVITSAGARTIGEHYGKINILIDVMIALLLKVSCPTVSLGKRHELCACLVLLFHEREPSFASQTDLFAIVE